MTAEERQILSDIISITGNITSAVDIMVKKMKEIIDVLHNHAERINDIEEANTPKNPPQPSIREWTRNLLYSKLHHGDIQKFDPRLIMALRIAADKTTQADLARRIGISRQALQQLLTGRVKGCRHEVWYKLWPILCNEGELDRNNREYWPIEALAAYMITTEPVTTQRSTLPKP